MKITIEKITPAMAAKYLEKNTCNRKLRPGHVTVMSNEMTAGRWRLTPQGISFSEDGTLIDGQNRLHAIIKSGVTVEMIVARGCPRETMELIDIGSKRSVSDMLHINDGLANCNMAVAAARQIVSFCFGYQNYVVSIGITRMVLDFYGDEIQEAVKRISHLKSARKAWVVGAIAFAMKSDESIYEFALSLGTGENIKRGSSALAARNWLINSTSEQIKASYSAGRYECLFNAMLNHSAGKKVIKLTRGIGGINHFKAKQRKFIETIRPEVARLR